MEMQPDVREAVNKVLDQAPDYPHYFDLSESERLLVLIALGFELGKQVPRESNGPERN
jgi:hypothetical protein